MRGNLCFFFFFFFFGGGGGGFRKIIPAQKCLAASRHEGLLLKKNFFSFFKEFGTTEKKITPDNQLIS